VLDEVKGQDGWIERKKGQGREKKRKRERGREGERVGEVRDVETGRTLSSRNIRKHKLLQNKTASK
jgi:hypothetical protein